MQHMYDENADSVTATTAAPASAEQPNSYSVKPGNFQGYDIKKNCH